MMTRRVAIRLGAARVVRALIYPDLPAIGVERLPDGSLSDSLASMLEQGHGRAVHLIWAGDCAERIIMDRQASFILFWLHAPTTHRGDVDKEIAVLVHRHAAQIERAANEIMREFA